MIDRNTVSPQRREIYDQLDKYAAKLGLKDAKVLDVGTAGDPKLPGARMPSEKYQWFGEGNEFYTIDNDPALEADYLGDICNTQFNDDQFDLVILSETLEHVYDFHNALKECNRITREYFIVDTPWLIPHHPTDSTPDYWRFSIQAYEKMLTEAGFKILDFYSSNNIVMALCRKVEPTKYELKPIPTWYTIDEKPIQWVDILMVTYERPAFTLESLLQIKQHTDYLHRVIVVDNGSQNTEHLEKARRDGLIDVLILLDKNYGLEPAKMYGLPFVRSPLFVNTDNDCLPQPRVGGTDWLTKLVQLMYDSPRYAAIACPPQVFVGADRDKVLSSVGSIVEWDKAGGSLRLMRTDLVRDVEGWRSSPSDMVEANRSEEWHICGKLRSLGYKVGYAKDVECFHLFGNDGEWGYGKVPHYHRDQWPRPTDKIYGSKEDFYAKYQQ